MDQQQFLDFLFNQNLEQVREILHVGHRIEWELEEERRTLEIAPHPLAYVDPVKPSKIIDTSCSDIVQEPSSGSGDLNVNYDSHERNRTESVCVSLNDLQRRAITSRGNQQPTNQQSASKQDRSRECTLVPAMEPGPSVRRKRPTSTCFATEVAGLSLDCDGSDHPIETGVNSGSSTQSTQHSTDTTTASAHSLTHPTLFCADSNELKNHNEDVLSEGTEESAEEDSCFPVSESIAPHSNSELLVPRKRQCTDGLQNNGHGVLPASSNVASNAPDSASASNTPATSATRPFSPAEDMLIRQRAAACGRGKAALWAELSEQMRRPASSLARRWSRLKVTAPRPVPETGDVEVGDSGELDRVVDDLMSTTSCIG